MLRNLLQILVEHVVLNIAFLTLLLMIALVYLIIREKQILVLLSIFRTPYFYACIYSFFFLAILLSESNPGMVHWCFWLSHSPQVSF